MFGARTVKSYFIASVLNWVVRVVQGNGVSRTEEMETFRCGGWWKLSGTGGCACKGISASMGMCLQLATECFLTLLNPGKKNVTVWK